MRNEGEHEDAINLEDLGSPVQSRLVFTLSIIIVVDAIIVVVIVIVIIDKIINAIIIISI